jgi:hypothetical protein
MKGLLTVIALMMTLNISAQNKIEITTDEKSGSVVYKGQVSFDDLKKEKSFNWLTRVADAYKPDPGAIEFLKSNLSRYRIISFMGTWCDDSHILVPQLFKVLSEAGFPAGELTMYAVDRTKTTADGSHTKYGVSFVPTIILLRNGQEAGRITESVRKSVEADIVNIIRSDK